MESTSSSMYFSFPTKRRLTPLKAYIAALICFGISAVFIFIAITQNSPGQLFPFIPSAIALASIIWGTACIVQPDPTKLRSSESSSAIVGLLVAVPTCLILLGVILEAQTQGFGWQKASATVKGLPYIRISARHPRRQYTVQYQYTWQDMTLEGATKITPTLLGDEPSVTKVTSHSLQVVPLIVGDQITIKVNPQQPDQSLYPQYPSFVIYPALLLFAWLGWSSFRRLQNPPKQGVFNG